MTTLSRRRFLGTGALAAGALAFGPAFWREALAAPATAGPGPYGPLGAPDANGISLPPGFTAREIARSGQPVAGTGYVWHDYPDGQATYALDDGGWVLVSNSENWPANGGSSAIRFDSYGNVVDAYRILDGTDANCGGGRTPWGTWLSCEEWDGGQVWECDPLGVAAAVPRPAMGLFTHEAAAVDPIGKRVYMTEDRGDGCLYRFTPTVYGDLSAGSLEVLVGATGGPVSWAPVPDPSAGAEAIRYQVDGVGRFSGGEGIWYDSGVVYFSAKGDGRIYEYDTATEVLDVLYDSAADASVGITGVDNLTVSSYGDLYVCEDNDDPEFSIGMVTRERQAARVATVSGPLHDGSELAGVIFAPSGKRMYFASQRANGTGAVYEVSGPFRVKAPPTAQPPRTGEPKPLAPKPPTRPSTPPPEPPGGGAGLTEPLGLRLALVRRISRTALLRRGVAVHVTVSRPGTITVALRTGDLETEDGRRGSTDRPRTVALARTQRKLSRAGRHRIVLKPRGKAARRLRRSGTLRGQVTVHARPESGPAQVTTRPVRLLASRAR